MWHPIAAVQNRIWNCVDVRLGTERLTYAAAYVRNVNNRADCSIKYGCKDSSLRRNILWPILIAGKVEVAGVIIAVFALIVSGFVAWENYFSPFRVKIYCGNPRLEPAPLVLKDRNTVTRFAVILPLYFANTGASDGIVSDIVLIVRSVQYTWLFQPFFYTKYGMQSESALGRKLTEDPSNEPFYPIHWLGKEKLHRSIVFGALPNDERFPLGDNPLLPAIYSFQVQTLELLRRDYENKLIFNVDLSKEQVSSLSAANCIIPFV